jgi:hypothetical protein
MVAAHGSCHGSLALAHGFMDVNYLGGQVGALVRRNSIQAEKS